jgi:hypothetical protein
MEYWKAGYNGGQQTLSPKKPKRLLRTYIHNTTKRYLQNKLDMIAIGEGPELSGECAVAARIEQDQ